MPTPDLLPPDPTSSATPGADPSIGEVEKAVLARADANGDGTISAAELTTLQEHMGLDATLFAADVARIDTNGDGAISSSELIAFLTKADTNGDGLLSASELHALAPLFSSDTLQLPTTYVPLTTAEVVTDVFSFFGAASTGVITTAQLAELQGHFAADATTIAAQVAKVDANGDGVISTAELTAYVAAADANGDGHLSLAELHGLVPIIGVAVHAGAPSAFTFGHS